MRKIINFIEKNWLLLIIIILGIIIRLNIPSVYPCSDCSAWSHWAYKINEADKVVIIYAIVDGRREYHNLI